MQAETVAENLNVLAKDIWIIQGFIQRSVFGEDVLTTDASQLVEYLKKSDDLKLSPAAKGFLKKLLTSLLDGFLS